MTHCAAVSIIGRPSSGKSTLLNAICGRRVSITAPSPQTTWNAIRGIYTDERGQLIFTDTPGYHLSEKQLNRRLQDVTVTAVGEADSILYVIDSSRAPGEEELAIAGLLSSADFPVVAVLNKTDLPQSRPKDVRSSILPFLPDAVFIEMAAVTGQGIDILLKTLFARAPEGPLLYPPDFYTDQPPEFRIAEIIRGFAVNRVSQELPHSLYVEIADLETDNASETLWIRAFINVERESQKGMIVGKGGVGIKAIRKGAQAEIARLFPYRIHLDLRVKTRGKWRKKADVLKKLIY